MSAIFGILRFDGGAVAARDLERMGNVLAHRGPDGRKSVIDGPVGLGHCLMRVNQEDVFEAQPLRDREADLTLVADCRIDNREELADAFGIGAAELRDMPDSALVLRAYKEWGEDCAAHLLGDFAFAIWDGRAGKLVLGRDHMGPRPIFYHRQGAFLVFATEIKALWAVPDVPRVIPETAIAYRLMSYPERPEGGTIFEGILGLPGAGVMTATADGTVSLRRYWLPHADPVHQGRDEAYYIKTYRELLAEAVACRLRRTLKPAALLLSGGYDSTAIAGLAAPVLAPQGRKLVALSAVLPEDFRGPARDVRRWVELCRRDMPHLDIRYFVRRKETALTDLERFFAAGDRPASIIHHVRAGLYTMAVAAGACVVMDGLGSDYTISPRGAGALGRFLRTGQFRRFVSEARANARVTGRPSWRVFAAAVKTLMPVRIARALGWLKRSGAPLWEEHALAPAFARSMFAGGVIDPRKLRGQPRDITRTRDELLRVLARQSDGANTAGTATPASYGLELVMPFHDKRLVEFGLAIPEDLYVKNGRSRYLACAALADVYPREFQTRDPTPNDSIDPDLHAMVDSIRPQLMAEADRMANSKTLSRYVDFEKIRAMLAAPPHAVGRTTHRRIVFVLRSILIARYVEWFSRQNR